MNRWVATSVLILVAFRAEGASLFPDLDQGVEKVIQHFDRLLDQRQVVLDESFVLREHFRHPEVLFSQSEQGRQYIIVRLYFTCAYPLSFTDWVVLYLDVHLTTDGDITNLLPALSEAGNRDQCTATEPAPDFSGTWKTDCANDFGISIAKQIQGSVYEINFCGPGGCSQDGQWRPASPILGDSAYTYSDGVLLLHSADHSTAFRRCAAPSEVAGRN